MEPNIPSIWRYKLWYTIDQSRFQAWQPSCLLLRKLKKKMAFTAIPKQNSWIGHFWVPKTLTFKMWPSAQPFLWKWVLFAWEWKIISTSKAEHLTSFWYRGPGELRNGLFLINWTEEMQEYAKYVYSEVKEFVTLCTMNHDLLILSEQ